MKWPRARISTLMFLVVIVALAVALVVEKRRSARLVVEAQALAENERRRAIVEATRAYTQQITNAQLADQVATLRRVTPEVKSSEPKSP